MVTLNDLRVRFTENDGLPFSEVLTESHIQAVLDEHGVEFRDRLFNPLVTIWGFLSQVLSEDHSCRDAVSRIVAHRANSQEQSCSPNTAAYCKARSRLSCDVLSTLARRAASDLEGSARDDWKWLGRSVYIVDGSYVSMPDILRCKTPEMVLKEIWAHVLAYNMLRTVMAAAAHEEDVQPREISFKGAKQTVTAFAPKIEAAEPQNRPSLIKQMLKAIAYHRVGNRPGRWEPRAVKRRPNRLNRLTYARELTKLPENRQRWH